MRGCTSTCSVLPSECLRSNYSFPMQSTINRSCAITSCRSTLSCKQCKKPSATQQVRSCCVVQLTSKQRIGHRWCITGCTLRLLLLDIQVAPDHFGVFVYRCCCTRESTAKAERGRGVGDRGRGLVLEATAMDRMDRADFVRVAAGAASTLVVTSFEKKSLAADVLGVYVATIFARRPRNETPGRASNP